MSVQAVGTELKPVSPDRAAYLAGLLARVGERVSLGDEKWGWLQELRSRAAALASERAIPSTRDEEWRFTDLSELLRLNLQAAEPVDVPAESVAALSLPEAAQSRLVFVNGVFAPHLSDVAGLPPGVLAGNLLGGELPVPVEEYLGKQPGGEEVFAALNTAGLTDAAVVWVPKDVAVAAPVHLLFVSAAGEGSFIVQPRCLVVAEHGSSVTLVEHYATVGLGCPDKPAARSYFTNAVTEIWAGENAAVTHIRVQREGAEAFHVGRNAVAQARNSRYTCYAVSLGAKLSRHNLEVFQTGEGTETTLNGLTMIVGEQMADTHSVIALNHPHGKSRQLHKCIVDDRAHSVFNGKVFVPKAAQLTDAAQLSRNLLLSPKARVDTKPQLEITADNVKCSHGATVSQLDAEEVFYLQSRGLNAADARNLLIDSFAGEVIGQIPVDSLRKMLSRCVGCRMDSWE
ncbi:MAG: Fe-S cluster assembly protein SufD [Oscillatoria princeps RMCB-10]|jgi:Fe-S cluster assembly protein SufD|nr:Fe-S cluster assembly protein SufD [Oscillatoria princeps RMCB-10]